MYGEVEMIRRRASQLREQATDVRALADRLVTQVEAIDWHGRAADSMRTRIQDRAEHLRAVAHAHDNAADALDRHQGEVARAKSAIAEIEQQATSLIADARARIARVQAHDDPDGVRREASPDDRRLVAFVPPPSGHQQWLTTELPGKSHAHR